MITSPAYCTNCISSFFNTVPKAVEYAPDGQDRHVVIPVGRRTYIVSSDFVKVFELSAIPMRSKYLTRVTVMSEFASEFVSGNHNLLLSWF